MLIHRAMRKYGVDNFDFVPLCDCAKSDTELSSNEIRFIELTHATDRRYGYNLTRGGDGTSGRPCSPETRQKIRTANLGKSLTPERRLALSSYWKGRKRTAETRKKMSEAWRGKKKSPLGKDQRARISQFQRGRQHSQETIAKTSAALRGRKRGPLSEEHKNKLSNALKGKAPLPVMLNHDGRTQRLGRWAEEYGIPYDTLCQRIYRGWSVERALKWN